MTFKDHELFSKVPLFWIFNVILKYKLLNKIFFQTENCVVSNQNQYTSKEEAIYTNNAIKRYNIDAYPIYLNFVYSIRAL